MRKAKQGNKLRKGALMRFFDSAGSEDYNDKAVNFVVHHILPIFKYLFIVGMLGAVPVIIVTAIKTAQSMFETDESARDHKA
jgi:hypothetical protein